MDCAAQARPHAEMSRLSLEFSATTNHPILGANVWRSHRLPVYFSAEGEGAAARCQRRRAFAVIADLVEVAMFCSRCGKR